ncbi:MAG: FliH/SctL family protein [Balneolaceae bacterium]
MSLHKIIDSEKISWTQKDSAKLNYRMIFEDHDAENEKKIKEQKKAEIKEILKENDAEWELELNKASEAAYRKGLEQGFEDGFKAAQNEIDNRFTVLENVFSEAHKEWRERQEELNPGLLDMVFDLAEKILELPVENEEIRKKMSKELTDLLHKVDKESRPKLMVCRSDYEFITELIKKHHTETIIHLDICEVCNPGEFIFETERVKVIQKFKQMLIDFKNGLTIPTWK